MRHATSPNTDSELLHRSLRYIVTVMVPIGIAFAVSARSWLVYAVIGATTSFLGDAGGPPLSGCAACWPARPRW